MAIGKRKRGRVRLVEGVNSVQRINSVTGRVEEGRERRREDSGR